MCVHVLLLLLEATPIAQDPCQLSNVLLVTTAQLEHIPFLPHLSVLLATIVMVLNSNQYPVQLVPTKLQEVKQQKLPLVPMYLQVIIMMNKVKTMHRFK